MSKNKNILAKKQNKAVTLLEMTIVMAILAILAVLVVTFCSLAKNYTLSISSDEVTLTDMDEIKEMYELWITSFDSEDVTIEVYENKLYTSYNSLSYSLTFGDLDGEIKFYGSCPSKENSRRQILFCDTDKIQSMNFDFIQNENNSFYLVILTVTYIDLSKTGVEEELSMTFLKTIRCASVVKGSTS